MKVQTRLPTLIQDDKSDLPLVSFAARRCVCSNAEDFNTTVCGVFIENNERPPDYHTLGITTVFVRLRVNARVH